MYGKGGVVLEVIVVSCGKIDMRIKIGVYIFEGAFVNGEMFFFC